MRANTFEYDGTTWTREWNPVMSNTGKSVVDSTEIFRGTDGTVIYKAAGKPNRARMVCGCSAVAMSMLPV
jgi:hypothetical protein